MSFYCCNIINQVIQIARIAGLEIMKIYMSNARTRINTYTKIDQSPVTDADLFSHQVIVSLLTELTPNIPIISEENHVSWEECKEWNCFWVIDPLDGTKEFLLRNGEFTVNIALVEYGQPIMGVVYLPVHKILYVACHGKSWKINANGNRKLLNFFIKTEFFRDLIIVMSRNHVYSYERKLLNSHLINVKNYKVINIGSSWKFCLVAERIAQFYPRFSSTKIWDTAAGHAIAQSAGALVNTWDGYPLNYSNINKCFLNPGFYVSWDFCIGIDFVVNF